MKRVFHFLAISVALLCFAGGCGRAPAVEREVQMRMSTFCEVQLVAVPHAHAKQLLRGAFAVMDRYEKQLSIYDPASEVSRVNKLSVGQEMAVSPDLFRLLQDSYTYSRMSDGMFDITVLPLLEVWGFFKKDFHRPTEEEIAGAKMHVGWDAVVLREADGKGFVSFSKPGMKIDLGGIAKGYIGDRVSDYLLDKGVDRFLVNIGGNMYAHGLSPSGKAWEIGVQDPRDKNMLVGTLVLHDEAVATSGDYERFFMQDGVRYSHLMDPKTGYPHTGVASVTVVAPNACIADVAGKVLFFAPESRRQSFVDTLQVREAIVFTIDEQGGIVEKRYTGKAGAYAA